MHARTINCCYYNDSRNTLKQAHKIDTRQSRAETKSKREKEKEREEGNGQNFCSANT